MPLSKEPKRVFVSNSSITFSRTCRVANHVVPSDVYVDLLVGKKTPTERKKGRKEGRKAREQRLHELVAVCTFSNNESINFFLFY
jgi:hypothetical protein